MTDIGVMPDIGVNVGTGPLGCTDPVTGAASEWLLTDGLGGYAMGTASGLRTRRYHGLLVVTTVDGRPITRPGPVARRHLALAALDPVLVIGDRRYRLATDEWAGGVIDPAGSRLPASVQVRPGSVRHRWVVGDVVLEREVAMVRGRPAVGDGDRHADAEPPPVRHLPDGALVAGAWRVRGRGCAGWDGRRGRRAVTGEPAQGRGRGCAGWDGRRGRRAATGEPAQGRGRGCAGWDGQRGRHAVTDGPAQGRGRGCAGWDGRPDRGPRGDAPSREVGGDPGPLGERARGDRHAAAVDRGRSGGGGRGAAAPGRRPGLLPDPVPQARRPEGRRGRPRPGRPGGTGAPQPTAGGVPAGLGSVSETADGDAPHTPSGCPFQAWSVAELLRLLR